MSVRNRFALVTTTLVTSLVLAACGGDDGSQPQAVPPDASSAAAGSPETAGDQTPCASFDADCVEDVGENTVEARGILFRPDELTVAAGTTVTFVNRDAVDHTVTAGDKDAPMPDQFDEQLPEQGSEATITFDEPGTYAYFCEIHPSTMTGTITVQ